MLHGVNGHSLLDGLIRHCHSESFAAKRDAAARGIKMPHPQVLWHDVGVFAGMRDLSLQEDKGIFCCGKCEVSATVRTVATDAIFQGHQQALEDVPFKRVYADPPLAGIFRDAKHAPHEMLDALDSRRVFGRLMQSCCGKKESGSAGDGGLGASKNPLQGLLSLALVSAGQSSSISLQLSSVAISGSSVAGLAAEQPALAMASASGSSFSLSISNCGACR